MLKWSGSNRYLSLASDLRYACCCCSVAQLCLTLCSPMDWSMPGFPLHHQLPKFAQTHIHQFWDTIQLSHPLSSLFPLTFCFSHHQSLFQWVSPSHLVVKVLKLQLQHQPSSEYLGLIFFRIDWFHLLTVQGILLQHRSLKASVIRCSAFFIVQLFHLHMTTGKTIA